MSANPLGDRRPSELRQRELVDAALHLIATEGITALTTRRLADAVGLSSGAIFRHFPTLDDLLAAVVAQVEVVLDATYPPAALPPMTRLEHFIAARAHAVGAQLGILRLVLSEQFLLSLPADGAARLTACVVRTRRFIEQCLRDGQAAGEVRADLAPEALAPIVMGTVSALALVPDRGRRREADARATKDALLLLLSPPAAAPALRRTRTR